MRKRKSIDLMNFLRIRGGQRDPGHYPGHQPPLPTEPGATGPEQWASSAAQRPLHVKLGPAELGAPLSIKEVAALIGCSPWTVRQTLIPRGLPYFRFTTSGRLTFYTKQVVGWIESKQKGG